MEQIDAANIPLRLKNVRNPAGQGTLIYPTDSPSYSRSLSSGRGAVEPAISKSVFMASNGYYGEAQHRRTPTAVTSKDNITVLNALSNGRCNPSAFLAQISERISRQNITIDLISSSKQQLSLAISTTALEDEAQMTEEIVPKLEEIGIVTVAKDMAIISVIGHKMRNMVGIAGKSLVKFGESLTEIGAVKLTAQAKSSQL